MRTRREIGYARAANRGARRRESDSYLLVNNDAFVHRPGTVRAMLEALEAPSVAIVYRPGADRPDLTIQPTVSALQTPAVALVRASGLSRLVPNRWQPSWSTHWDQSFSREVRPCRRWRCSSPTAWDDGRLRPGDVLLRRGSRLLLSRPASGWKVWFTADAEFLHIGGGSTATRWSNPRGGR